jgi:hypothetical protein
LLKPDKGHDLSWVPDLVNGFWIACIFRSVWCSSCTVRVVRWIVVCVCVCVCVCECFASVGRVPVRCYRSLESMYVACLCVVLDLYGCVIA